MAIHDLTRPIAAGMQVYPGDPPVEIEPHAIHDEEGYRVSALRMGSHAGTHVDAPAHVVADGTTLDAFPVETFSFEAVRIDRTDRSARDPIDIASDELPDPDASRDLVAVWTGWADRWGSERYFDHPYLTAETARRCAKRGCHVAVDAPSVDPTPTENASGEEPDGVPAHEALLGADRLIVENLAGLGALPRRFRLDAYPLSIADADGAPARAIARTSD